MKEHNGQWCIECDKPFFRHEGQKIVVAHFGSGIGLLETPKPYGLCPDCKRHLEIGRLVEEMPEFSALCRYEKKWAFGGRTIWATNDEVQESPLKALRRGKEGK